MEEETSAIDKVLALAEYMDEEQGVQKVYGSDPLTQWEEEFIMEMVARLNRMADDLAVGETVELDDDDEVFTPRQIETIDKIWNKAGQPELED